jgi:hypothetical protein
VAVLVGQPTWSATTPISLFSRCNRTMVRAKFFPTGPITQLVRRITPWPLPLPPAATPSSCSTASSPAALVAP